MPYETGSVRDGAHSCCGGGGGGGYGGGYGGAGRWPHGRHAFRLPQPVSRAKGMMSSYEIGSIHHGTHSSQHSTASSVTYEQPAPAPAPAPVPERSSLTYRDATRKERNAGFTKHGNNDDGTHGAHKLSHELATAILPHVKGRPGLVDAVARDLNRDQNIRIKTAKGNLETDRDNDKELIDLIKSGETGIFSVEATKRAVQAFKGSANANTGTIQQVHDFIGNLEFAGMQISELASGAGGSFFTKG